MTSVQLHCENENIINLLDIYTVVLYPDYCSISNVLFSITTQTIQGGGPVWGI